MVVLVAVVGCDGDGASGSGRWVVLVVVVGSTWVV
jgi:hypothetical protein